MSAAFDIQRKQRGQIEQTGIHFDMTEIHKTMNATLLEGNPGTMSLPSLFSESSTHYGNLKQTTDDMLQNLICRNLVIKSIHGISDVDSKLEVNGILSKNITNRVRTSGPLPGGVTSASGRIRRGPVRQQVRFEHQPIHNLISIRAFDSLDKHHLRTKLGAGVAEPTKADMDVANTKHLVEPEVRFVQPKTDGLGKHHLRTKLCDGVASTTHLVEPEIRFVQSNSKSRTHTWHPRSRRTTPAPGGMTSVSGRTRMNPATNQHFHLAGHVISIRPFERSDQRCTKPDAGQTMKDGTIPEVMDVGPTTNSLAYSRSRRTVLPGNLTFAADETLVNPEKRNFSPENQATDITPVMDIPKTNSLSFSNPRSRRSVAPGNLTFASGGTGMNSANQKVPFENQATNISTAICSCDRMGKHQCIRHWAGCQEHTGEHMEDTNIVRIVKADSRTLERNSDSNSYIWNHTSPITSISTETDFSRTSLNPADMESSYIWNQKSRMSSTSTETISGNVTSAVSTSYNPANEMFIPENEALGSSVVISSLNQSDKLQRCRHKPTVTKNDEDESKSKERNTSWLMKLWRIIYKRKNADLQNSNKQGKKGETTTNKISRNSNLPVDILVKTQEA